MDPKTGQVAEVPKEVPSTFTGPHTPTSDDVKKDPRFLARQEIGRRVMQQRDEEQNAFRPDILDDEGNIRPADPLPEAPKTEEAAPPAEVEQDEQPAEPDQAEPEEAAQPPEQEEERELIVDGKRVSVPLSKIIDAGVRTFQKETAADMRLAAATELQRTLEARAQQFQPSKDAEQRQEPVQSSQPSEEDAALAHDIQFGTEEQARNAIAKLRSAGRDTNPQKLVRFVQESLQSALPDQIAFHNANQRVRSDYKEIFSDPDYEQMFMLQETKARQAGDRRPYDELYRDIAESMVTKFSLRKAEVQQPKGEPIPGRIARKAAAPRPAQGAGGAMPSKQTEAKRPMTTAEYVQMQRQKRGLQPLNNSGI